MEIPDNYYIYESYERENERLERQQKRHGYEEENMDEELTEKMTEESE